MLPLSDGNAVDGATYADHFSMGSVMSSFSGMEFN